MASSFAAKVATSSFIFKYKNTSFPSLPVPISISVPKHKPISPRLPLRLSAKSQTEPVNKKKRSSSASNKKKKKSNNAAAGLGGQNSREGYDKNGDASSSLTTPLVLPKPPAGFVVDDDGMVLMASSKRIATIVDSDTEIPLECVIKRVFTSSRGAECMLLCPLDMPVLILKSTNLDGGVWTAVGDDEVKALLPMVDYALAKVNMYLVHSGFCLTARGGFSYTEDDILDLRSDDGQDIDGLPNEGIEITCFLMDGLHYMIYTPLEPLLFVAAKDENGMLQIIDDDLLEDPAVLRAIDEETEFNAFVAEEAVFRESLLADNGL